MWPKLSAQFGVTKMSLAQAAAEALTGKVSLQSEIRKIVDTHNDLGAASEIADQMSEFRSASQTWIDQGGNAEEVQSRQKQVNNVINDVSRICRQLIGKSIVCKSRKHHTYEAVEPTPRRTSVPTTPAAPSKRPLNADDVWAELSPLERARMIEKIADTFSVSVMQAMLERKSTEEFMEIIREAKGLTEGA